MTKINLGEVVTIIANIGVIAGLVFLAYEIRQNTAQMRAEAAYAIHQDAQRLNESIYGDTALSELLVKADAQYESLEDAERWRVNSFYFSEINVADFVMGLDEEGFSDVVFRIDDWIVKNFKESPGRRAFIEDVYKPANVDEPFVRSERLHQLLIAE
jgi:hypothetical protein